MVAGRRNKPVLCGDIEHIAAGRARHEFGALDTRQPNLTVVRSELFAVWPDDAQHHIDAALLDCYLDVLSGREIEPVTVTLTTGKLTFERPAQFQCRDGY